MVFLKFEKPFAQEFEVVPLILFFDRREGHSEASEGKAVFAEPDGKHLMRGRLLLLSFRYLRKIYIYRGGLGEDCRKQQKRYQDHEEVHYRYQVQSRRETR